MLTGNIDFACDYIEKHFEGVTVSKPQGTYMLFVDCTDWCKAHGKTIEDVEHACWDVALPSRTVPCSLAPAPAHESGFSPFPHRGGVPPHGQVRF